MINNWKSYIYSVEVELDAGFVKFKEWKHPQPNFGVALHLGSLQANLINVLPSSLLFLTFLLLVYKAFLTVSKLLRETLHKH